jgi:hypothetical protein
MVSEEFAASLTTVIDPVALPVEVGANDAVTVRFSDGLSVTGGVSPFVVKPTPWADKLAILTAAFPVFVNTICLVADLPVDTIPKLRSAGVALS